MTDEKDMQQLKKRLIELADKAYSRNIYTYTPFLGLAEQQAVYAVEREVSHAGIRMEGGASLCERRIIRFGDPGYEEEFPIVGLEVLPKTPKFAENLTHRDFLGAVMNLGIQRDVVGDIFLSDGKAIPKKGALLFCHENIADYIVENLDRVRHTNVVCRRAQEEIELANAEPEQISLTEIDAVTVRGFGKFIFYGQTGVSRKGKSRVEVGVFGKL